MFYLLLEKANVPEEVTAILERTGLKGSVVMRCSNHSIDNSAEEVDGRRVDGDEVHALLLHLVCLFISNTSAGYGRKELHPIPPFHDYGFDGFSTFPASSGTHPSIHSSPSMTDPKWVRFLSIVHFNTFQESCR